MVFATKFLSCVLLAITYASSTSAWAVDHAFEKVSARNMRAYSLVHRELELYSYHPEPTFETFGSGIAPPVDPDARLANDLDSTTLSFVSKRLGISRNNIGMRSGYTVEKDNERFAYLQQYHDGIPFVNAVANVAWKNGLVVSFGSSFVKPKTIAASKPTIPASSLISKAEEAFNGKYNGHPTKLEYLVRPDGSAALVHTIQVQNDVTPSWFAVHVDAHSGEILSAINFVSQLSYQAVPFNRYAVDEGQEFIVDPEDLLASPEGWTSNDNTEGNNALVYKAQYENLTLASAPGVFNYTYDLTLDPAGGNNVDAARTNAFYVFNKVHDYAYRYGFTEDAFNFQKDNFGKGGLGNDAVYIGVQDTIGMNNAFFASPPEGQYPIAWICIFNLTTPNRDGSLQNDLLVHEMTHGISNRLTGGGSSGCLAYLIEASGLGEGYSDAMANWAHQSSADVPDFIFNEWVFNRPRGGRRKAYSTSMAVNNDTYASIKGETVPHYVGEVWANMLHNVYAALVAEYGWSAEAFTNPEGTEGNVVFLHHFMDALRIQPCGPDFINARDAWIQADANRYDGANRCLLWKVFASRGLGVRAAKQTNDFTVPPTALEKLNIKVEEAIYSFENSHLNSPLLSM